MNAYRAILLILTSLCAAAVAAESGAPVLGQYKLLTSLQGDWMLSPAAQQEGKTTKKGPAAKMVGTDQVAMRFQVIGKGSTVQDNLLPGTPKEMATMYHCDSFNDCNQIQARHYCAKQNQPELVASVGSDANSIELTCDPSTAVCNSSAGHVHMISHQLSDNGNHLKTTYTIYKDGKKQKDSVYYFDRKN